MINKDLLIILPKFHNHENFLEYELTGLFNSVTVISYNENHLIKKKKDGF